MPCNGTTTASTFQRIDPIAAMREHGKNASKQSERTIYFCILRMAKKSSYVNLAAGNLSERVQMAMVRKAQADKHLMTASYAKTRRAKVVIFKRDKF